MTLLPSKTLESETVEGSVLETIMLLQKAERSTRLNTDKKSQLSLSIDAKSEVATITIRMPLEIKYSGSNTIIKAKEYTAHLAFDETELTGQ